MTSFQRYLSFLLTSTLEDSIVAKLGFAKLIVAILHFFKFVVYTQVM